MMQLLVEEYMKIGFKIKQTDWLVVIGLSCPPLKLQYNAAMLPLLSSRQTGGLQVWTV